MLRLKQSLYALQLSGNFLNNSGPLSLSLSALSSGSQLLVTKMLLFSNPTSGFLKSKRSFPFLQTFLQLSESFHSAFHNSLQCFR